MFVAVDEVLLDVQAPLLVRDGERADAVRPLRDQLAVAGLARECSSEIAGMADSECSMACQCRKRVVVAASLRKEVHAADRNVAKYLNSPETPVFEKGHELYGLFQARQGIRAEGRVIVVEGYMDVVALAQYGVTNAVATLGTATTPWHVQKLLRQTDEVVFCFDGDVAGRRAAWRALENALEHLQDGKQVKFLFLPPEHDPDSYVRAEGRPAFDRLLSDRPEYIVYASGILEDELYAPKLFRNPDYRHMASFGGYTFWKNGPKWLMSFHVFRRADMPPASAPRSAAR